MFQKNFENWLIALFDKCLAFLTGIFFLIPGLVIAVLIKISSKGPILYWSTRVGKDGVLFSMPKFRTMFQDAPIVATDLLKDPQRFITPVGSFLRKSSLDELPQLWCILRGQMAIVGPRPALFNQYELTRLRRDLGVLKLLPGLTGWAQINGRDSITDQEKVILDAQYLQSRSIYLNLKIMLTTVTKVLSRNSISH